MVGFSGPSPPYTQRISERKRALYSGRDERELLLEPEPGVAAGEAVREWVEAVEW
jgi:hypothetical protein